MFRVRALTDSSLAILAALLLPTGLISAQTLLSVDFQHTTISVNPGETQTGFEAFTNDGSASASETRTFSTVGGDVDVTISGHQSGLIEGFFNRTDLDNSGSLTVADLYEDFVFSNGPAGGGGSPLSMTLTLSGAGIAASTAYSLTFYSFDPEATGGSHTVSFDGASGTTGSAAAIAWDGTVNPTTDGQYATTGTFTSDGAGVLTIDLEDNWTGATDSTGIRLNAFELASAAPDTTPPTIVPPTNPADEASGVLVSSDLMATFDENIALTGAGTVTIRDLGAGPDVVIDLSGPDPDGSVSVTGAGNDLTISPASNLVANNDYAIQISADAVEDLATSPNAFAGILDDTTWNFQTAAADTTPPTIVPPTNPADEASGVLPSSDFVATFDENIALTGAGTVTIRDLGPGPDVVIDLSGPDADGTVSVSGADLTISPTSNLVDNNDYAIQISADAVEDLAVPANAFAGILDDTIWNFTTGSAPVQLLAVDFQNTSAGGAPVTQSGFETFDESDAGSATYSTPGGDVTVTMTGLDAALGGHYNRGGVTNGGALTYADIYNDFAFKNGAAPQSITLGFSGPGIAANTSYVLTFYSYDSHAFGGTDVTVDFTGISGTSGSASLVTPHDGTVPATDDAYATSAIFTSDGSGVLTIDLTASGYDTGDGPRLNAFELSATTGVDNTFATWIAGYSVGGQTGIGDDPDGDGNDNGVENFFGTAPDEFSQGLVSGAADTGAGTFTFTHPQGTLASDLSAAYQWSVDLENFFGDGVENNGTTVTFSTSTDAGITTVTATVTGPIPDKLFVNVLVTQN